MPNIKSQKDRVAQSKKEAAHNKAIKSNLKTVVKKADAAIDSNAENKGRRHQGRCFCSGRCQKQGCHSQEHCRPQDQPHG